MDTFHPSESVNHCHALLNALRAALYGEESRLLSRFLLGLEQEGETFATLSGNVEYIEKLFSAFQSEETVILCLDDTQNNHTKMLLHNHMSILSESAKNVSSMLQKIKSREDRSDALIQDIVTYVVGHTRARETLSLIHI